MITPVLVFDAAQSTEYKNATFLPDGWQSDFLSDLFDKEMDAVFYGDAVSKTYTGLWEIGPSAQELRREALLTATANFTPGGTFVLTIRIESSYRSIYRVQPVQVLHLELRTPPTAVVSYSQFCIRAKNEVLLMKIATFEDNPQRTAYFPPTRTVTRAESPIFDIMVPDLEDDTIDFGSDDDTVDTLYDTTIAEWADGLSVSTPVA